MLPSAPDCRCNGTSHPCSCCQALLAMTDCIPSLEKKTKPHVAVCVSEVHHEGGRGRRPQTPTTLALPLKGQHLAIFLKPTLLSYTSRNRVLFRNQSSFHIAETHPFISTYTWDSPRLPEAILTFIEISCVPTASRMLNY